MADEYPKRLLEIGVDMSKNKEFSPNIMNELAKKTNYFVDVMEEWSRLMKNDRKSRTTVQNKNRIWAKNETKIATKMLEKQWQEFMYTHPSAPNYKCCLADMVYRCTATNNNGRNKFARELKLTYVKKEIAGMKEEENTKNEVEEDVEDTLEEHMEINPEENTTENREKDLQVLIDILLADD